MKVIITNLQKDFALSSRLEKKLEQMAVMLLTEYKLETGELGIILAGNAYLQELNRSYRALDGPTDVLSFSMLDEGSLEHEAPGEELLVGDIYISIEKAAEQAREAGHTLEQELLTLTAHGLLHLLGFDHADTASEEVMKEKEQTVLSRLEENVN